MGSIAIVRQRLEFDKIVPVLLSTGRRRLMAAVVAAIAATALADWWVGPVSLGGLYIFPMLLAATILSWRATIALAFACALLRCTFDDSHYAIQYGIRFFTSFLTYVISGLFVVAVIRNREMALDHLSQITREQWLRNEAQERLKTLVESSPAAILTLNQQGTVLAANQAANTLFGLGAGEVLEGRPIKPFMPVLLEALRLGTGGKPFRTRAQAQGRRDGGDIFLADLWFSTYASAEGTHLAAIIVDSSDEMRERENQSLRQLSTNSRIVVAAVHHEVRNLCSAISAVYSNLKERDAPCRVEEIQGLEALVRSLGHVASLELSGREDATVEEVPLQQVLDDLRIIIEPNWREIDGSVCWTPPEPALRVVADRYGLLQVFLNLAQNSLQAVQKGAVRELTITTAANGQRAQVRFQDSGTGVAEPRRLFQPFQDGATGTGLGLFISRVLVRSYGGELRLQSGGPGCTFVVELPLANTRVHHA